MAQAVGDSSSGDGRNAVHAVPDGDAHGLLGTAVPERSHVGEQWQAASLEETQEEARGKQATKTMASRNAGLGDAPAQSHGRHQDPGRDLDDEPSGEGLPPQLGNGRDGAHKGVLVTREVGILLEAEKSTGAQHSLVEHLQKVDPGQEHQDRPVGLSPDAGVLHSEKKKKKRLD